MQIDSKDQALLLDIKKAALEARSFISEKSESEFLSNVMVQKAVEREIEIIGEAARRLSETAKASLPNLPFKSMVGVRNILAHDYAKVDPKKIYTIVTEDLLALINGLR